MNLIDLFNKFLYKAETILDKIENNTTKKQLKLPNTFLLKESY